jgi:uncharacterized membrane protein YkvA (DUF1232 family)
LVTTLAIGLATSLVAAAAALLIVAALARPRGLSPGEMLRVYPDLVRLLASLSKDPRVGRAVRWRLLVALAYNAQPFNLIPDFIPVIGFADNVVVTAWAVRSAIRTSGPAVVLSNWSGSRAGFALVCRLCRLKISDGEVEPPELVPMPEGRVDGRTRRRRWARAAGAAGLGSARPAAAPSAPVVRCRWSPRPGRL